MATKPVKVPANTRPDRSNLKNYDVTIDGIDKSSGAHGVKTSGIKTRGNGAATKGTTARGPMA